LPALSASTLPVTLGPGVRSTIKSEVPTEEPGVNVRAHFHAGFVGQQQKGAAQGSGGDDVAAIQPLQTLFATLFESFDWLLSVILPYWPSITAIVTAPSLIAWRADRLAPPNSPARCSNPQSWTPSAATREVQFASGLESAAAISSASENLVSPVTCSDLTKTLIPAGTGLSGAPLFGPGFQGWISAKVRGRDLLNLPSRQAPRAGNRLGKRGLTRGQRRQ